MAHPFAGKAESGRDRAKSLTKGYKTGGSVGKAATVNVAKYARGGKTGSDTKVPGYASGGRLDTFARGGRSKGKSKGHNTKININIAPKGDHPPLGAAPPPLGPPPMAGGLPPGLPPGGPPPGIGIPPGGPPGPKPPGMMNKGGVVKPAKIGSQPKGGSETGIGRKELAHIQKKMR